MPDHSPTEHTHTHELPSPDQGAVDYWNELYSSSEKVWSGNANPVLAREAGRRAAHSDDGTPRTALDLGCGEGADAIWLAGSGWRVTAVDIAETAIARGRAAAEAAGVADLIDWQRHDLGETFPAGSFDLVSAQFLHSQVELPREGILRRAAAAVASGGLLLIVGHGALPEGSAARHQGMHLPDAAETRASLQLAAGEWITLLEADEDRPGVGPDGEPTTHVDAVVLLQRLPA